MDTRVKIELNYHLADRTPRKKIRKALRTGWDAYLKRFDKRCEADLYDRYETLGIGSAAMAPSYAAAWAVINNEMELFVQNRQQLGTHSPLILPPPRAWFMWPVPDNVSEKVLDLYLSKGVPIRREPRPCLKQTLQWIDDFS